MFYDISKIDSFIILNYILVWPLSFTLHTWRTIQYSISAKVLFIISGRILWGRLIFGSSGKLQMKFIFFLGIEQARILKYPNRNEIVLCFTNLFHIVSIVYHTYASSLLKLYECWYFHEIREGTVTSWGRSFLGGAFFHLSTGGTFMACQGDLVFFNHLGSGTGFFITFLLLKIV